jgi:PAS domain S-box-containing protein
MAELHTPDSLDNAPMGLFTSTQKGRFLSVNTTFAHMLRYENREDLIESVTDIASQIYAEPADRQRLIRLLDQEHEVINHVGLLQRRDGTLFWGSMNIRAVRDDQGRIEFLQGFLTDITEQKNAYDNLKKLEWMLSGKTNADEVHDQGYGDLTALNTGGLILKSIGSERLQRFANDYLELLGTSSAIYEVNGDYAYGIFASGWCRMMDRASRRLCNTQDNRKAMDSGRWLCHESCWSDCAQQIIETSEPVDIACKGGIRMYGVPIMAHGHVVGAINFGYDNPPKDLKTLRKLSKDYQIDIDELQREAAAYNYRPPFIIELAKKRLHATARLIGSMIETKQVELALRTSEEHSAFLAETAFELVELTSIGDIYAYTVRKLRSLFKSNAIVSLVEYYHSENRWKMQVIEGLGEKTAEVSRLLGFDVENMEGDISTKYFEQITSEKLTELAFDIPGLFNKKVPADAGSAIRNLFSIHKLYCIAFKQDEKIFGNITIMTSKESEAVNAKLIESFVQQVSIFVKKQKAEEKIREKDIQFRKLSANLPDLIFQFTRKPDGSYCVPIASRGIRNIFGCTPEDVVDSFDAIAQVLHPDDADRVVRDIEYSAEHLTYFTCEFRVLIPGKPVQWIFSRSTPEKLPDGSVTWYGFNANITQLKQTELALRESEEKFRRIADNVTDVVWVTDLDMKPTYISPSVERVLGISPQEYLQRPLTDTYPSESIERFTQVLADEFEKEKDPESDKNRIFELEVKRYYHDGTIGWDAISANFIRDDQNRPIAIQGVSRDITERVKVEEALRESETRFKALHNASFGGIAIHDKGVILECNQGLTEITGYTYDELIGMDGLLLIAQGSRETVMNHILSGYEKPYEVMGVRSNGEEFPVRLEARNIPFKGKSVRVVEFRDITEQKRTEREYQQLQEQFAQSQKMDAVGRLAGGVAHDYNNMLSAMIGYAELVLERVEESSTVYRDVKEILNAANRSAELTRQLLAFSRKQTIAPKLLDMNGKIEQTLNMVRKLIGEDIELSWLPSSKASTILIDPSQLDQIIANLCINARDAIDRTGKITIETAAVEFDQDYCRRHADFVPGDYMLLAVSDTGCGMDRDTVENIFEPFFSLKGEKGTGLGMATVYGIVKQNSGFINVYSEPGKGTTIKIYLPRTIGKGEHRKKSGEDELLHKGQGQTILLVEDEKVIRDMAQSVLERLGYHVLTAESPDKAISLAENHRDDIALLLTDVVMPEMNGRELSNHVHKLCPNLKILYMSGYTANVIAHQGVLEEGIEFIQKPFSLKELGAKVHMILNQDA